MPGQVVGPAVQRLAAARLGRGFFPLAVLLLVGLSEIVTGTGRGAGPLLLVLGAPASAAAMLAYGQGAVQRAFGHPEKSWWRLATAGGLVPLCFGLYVLGWQGLRLIAQWNGAAGVATGVLFGALGAWTLLAWQRVSELETLAAVMTLGGGPGAGAASGSENLGTEREGDA